MAACRRVYDSRHLQADCQERDQLWNPTLGNRVWATFTFFMIKELHIGRMQKKLSRTILSSYIFIYLIRYIMIMKNCSPYSWSLFAAVCVELNPEMK